MQQAYISLISGNDGSTSPGSRLFTIDRETGAVSVNPNLLDRDAVPSYSLCVNASTSSVNASANSDQWKIVVNVKDVSDHKVKFVQSKISAGNR